MKIAVVDYGMGNIRSIYGALNHLGVDSIVLTNNLELLKSADKLILPGVGSFRVAMEKILSCGLDETLRELVVDKKKPILGICLGMQLMMRSSTEDGITNGLNYVDGEVTRFPTSSQLRVPHVGFNQVKINQYSKIYNGFEQDEVDFYFTHSYRALSEASINQSMCNYDTPFIASFEYENIVGVQFHPELSQNNGLKILKNFLLNF